MDGVEVAGRKTDPPSGAFSPCFSLPWIPPLGEWSPAVVDDRVRSVQALGRDPGSWEGLE